MSLKGKYVIMGVSGCGKSSVGVALAERLDARFVDGDDLHPQSNIDKMSRGEPLNDDDRRPWLAKVGQCLAGERPPVFLGCSALKRMYRDIIRAEAGKDIGFLHLSGSRDVLLERMKNRPGHFMPVSLLDSQLATLEPPHADELSVTVDIDQPIADIVEAFASRIVGGTD